MGSSELHGQLSTKEQPQPASVLPNGLETVVFETGNPETRAISAGSLDSCRVTATSSVVVVESVPGLMTSADFCMFVRPFADTIVHFRPLRLKTERNRYIVVIQFRSPADAHNFSQVYEGKHYLHGLVPDTCSIRDVRSIRFDSSAEDCGSSGAESGEGFPNWEMFPKENSDTLRGTCAVCLERLDLKGAAALVTTFCSHTMHAECLAQWDLNSCPVCRHTHELTPEASTCMNCNNRENLWMCVICAFVGCGIYKKKHAQAHFAETQHPFAMNLEDCTFWTGEKVRAGSVWDYISERFVNRLLTSEDGKIVELARDNASTAGAASSAEEGAVCCNSSAEVIAEDDENDRGLQAAVYASRMDAVVDDYRGRLRRLEAEHSAEKGSMMDELKRVRQDVAGITKEKRTLQKRISDAEKEMKTLRDKNEFLKSLNETLLRDKRAWNDEVEKLKKQVSKSEDGERALQEQLRDVMTHLEAQAKIAGSESCRPGASELHGGDVVRVGPSPRERLARRTHRR